MFNPDSMTAPSATQAPAWQAFVVDQGWSAFTSEDHAVWDLLYARQVELLRGRVVTEFIEGLDLLDLDAPGIPDLARLNARLHPRTGWTAVAVIGLVPDLAFFAMLAERVFPVGNFIRTRDQLDYLEEPDCFHDIFGHVPILAHPGMAAAMAHVGHVGVAAIAAGRGEDVARLYWHTVEFGLAKEDGETRILGAGLASSFGEAPISLEDPGLQRPRFTVADAIATAYRHDAMQPLYFVSDSLDSAVADLQGLPLVWDKVAA